MHCIVISSKWWSFPVLYWCVFVSCSFIRSGLSYTTSTIATTRISPTIRTLLLSKIVGGTESQYGSNHRFLFGNIILKLAAISDSKTVPSNVNEDIIPSSYDYARTPLLNFRDNNDTINYIDRLDDAIMGGISTSTVRQQSMDYAIWNGICRIDGGGFCGFRTNPFKTPFIVSNDTIGFYIKCRLVSDNEPERRVWKITTRTKPDRGELLYQAPFQFSNYNKNNNYDNIEWQFIYVPFDTFRLVRGPQVVENGPKLNVSMGIYQIGMTMSQFIFASTFTNNNNTIEKTLPNFRDGYFEVNIEEIGVYSATSNTIKTNDEKSILSLQKQEPIQVLDVFTKGELKKQKSLFIKMILVIVRLVFFTEQSQRRKSTLKILQKKYKMSRYDAIIWGYRRRLILSTKKYNINDHPIIRQFCYSRRMILSMLETLSILSIDTIRSLMSTPLKLFLFYPIRLLITILTRINPKKKKNMTTAIST
jgi:Complex I intermediate-associated protein 30 (CIA30)